MGMLRRLLATLGRGDTQAGPIERYRFSADWFSMHAPAWSQLLARHVGPSPCILEIGAYEGNSTVWLLENAFRNGAGGRLCSIDSWLGGEENDRSLMADVEARFDHNVALARKHVARHVHFEKRKGLSHPLLASMVAAGNRNGFDFVYIDGSHQAPDVLGDLVLCFLLLKVGGVFACDDYLWTVHPDPLHQPKIAIDAFCAVYAQKLRMIDGLSDYQKYFLKIAD